MIKYLKSFYAEGILYLLTAITPRRYMLTIYFFKSHVIKSCVSIFSMIVNYLLFTYKIIETDWNLFFTLKNKNTT